MSYRLIDMAWKARDIPATAKFVLMRLCGFADDDGGSIFPSLRRVADDCGLSERAVRDQFRHLETVGLLMLVEEGDPRTHRPRTYRVDISRLEAMGSNPGASVAPGPGTICPSLGHDVPQPGAPDAPTPGTTCPSPGARGAPKKSVTKIIENSIAPKKANNRLSEDEERFWAAYPSRGDHPNPRKPAIEVFRRLVRDGIDPEELIRGAQGYAAAMKRQAQHPKYIQQAANWLKNGGWQQYADPKAHGPPRSARPQVNDTPEFQMVGTR